MDLHAEDQSLAVYIGAAKPYASNGVYVVVWFDRAACRAVLEPRGAPKERAWRGMRLEYATVGVLCNKKSRGTHRGRTCICYHVHCSGQAVQREDRLAFVTATVVVL